VNLVWENRLSSTPCSILDSTSQRNPSRLAPRGLRPLPSRASAQVRFSRRVTRPNARSLNCNVTDIEENGVRLCLTVVDTPGFGDFVNNDERFAFCFPSPQAPSNMSLVGDQLLRTSSRVSTSIWNTRTWSTAKKSLTTVSMLACTSFSRRVTRKFPRNQLLSYVLISRQVSDQLTSSSCPVCTHA
jgi:hypothetical protein